MGDKEPLVGSSIKSEKKPLIYYEAYFVPDFDAHLRVPETADKGDAEKKWMAR